MSISFSFLKTFLAVPIILMIPNAYVWYLDKETMNEIKDGLCLSFDVFLIKVGNKVGCNLIFFNYLF